MNQPTLKNYIARHKLWSEMANKHPEQRERLLKKVKEADDEIIKYVTSVGFYKNLDYLNL
jgi:RAB protein geranylgeranyltransferase component A